jgi:hypothetical protein
VLALQMQTNAFQFIGRDRLLHEGAIHCTALRSGGTEFQVGRVGGLPLQRAEAYRTWLKQGVSNDELIAIRHNLQQERAFESKRFRATAGKRWSAP